MLAKNQPTRGDAVRRIDEFLPQGFCGILGSPHLPRGALDPLLDFVVPCRGETVGDDNIEGQFQRIEHLVDILAQGGGWYSITSKEDNYLDIKFGTRTDGAAVWIRALNTRLLSCVNANPMIAPIIYVKRIEHPPICERKLHALATKFGRHPKSRS